jgi:uncharacterized spore protein YtfJ
MEDTIKVLVEELKRLIETSKMIGAPIEYEDKIIIPVTKIGFAFGAGGGEGKGKGSKDVEGEGKGTGAGAGAGAGPVAAIVVFKGISGPDGIKVLQLEGLSGGSIAKSIAEGITSVAGIVTSKKEKSD